MLTRLLTALAMLAVASVAESSERDLVRMVSVPSFAGAPCLYISWRDEIRFYNSTATPQDVRLIGVSNGVPSQHPAVVTVPPGRVISSLGPSGPGSSWNPTPPAALWLVKLDIPDGVIVESQGQIVTQGTEPGSCVPFTNEIVHGSFPLPMPTGLVAPGTPQVHLVADLGTQDYRVNVGIYNGGVSPGHASIDVKRSCNDEVIVHRDVTVGANELTQISGIFSGVSIGCFGAGLTPDYAVHVIVTVDQPSTSYSVALSNDVPPIMPISISR